MTFLPIVDRELRVASRRNLTYWSRPVAAGFLLVIFGVILSTTIMARGMPWSVGMIEFTALKWVAFGLTCAAGVFLTSDSLSEEKREGTIGLLFLTDLRGYDVVLGKLLSHSLQAFYGLVAAFPILALPLMVGGVTGTQFAHSLLIICNSLFLSLAIGMFVSSLSREVLKAMNAAALLSVLFLLIFPWIDWVICDFKPPQFKPIFSHASPGYLFVMQDSMRPADFWFDCGLQHFLGWLFLAITAFCLPRAWQEKSSDVTGLVKPLLRRWRFGGQKFRLRLRRVMLERNPFQWIASRDRWLPRFMGLAFFCMAGWMTWLHWCYGTSDEFWSSLRFYRLLVLFVGLWLASQSCRCFSEAVRGGAMELMLVTPLAPRRIVKGQWTSLVRFFIIPILILMGIMAVESIHEIRAAWAAAAAAAAASPKVATVYVTNNYLVVSFINGEICLLTGFAALAWVGMWMGVTSRKTSVAILKTVLFVVILPNFVEIFIEILGMGTLMTLLRSVVRPGAIPFWLPQALGSAFEVAKNIFFIVWARNRLVTHFREAAVRSGQGPVAPRRQFHLAPVAPVARPVHP